MPHAVCSHRVFECSSRSRLNASPESRRGSPSHRSESIADRRAPRRQSANSSHRFKWGSMFVIQGCRVGACIFSSNISVAATAPARALDAGAARGRSYAETSSSTKLADRRERHDCRNQTFLNPPTPLPADASGRRGRHLGPDADHPVRRFAAQTTAPEPTAANALPWRLE